MGESARNANYQAVLHMFDNSLCRMHYSLAAEQAPWTVLSFAGVNLQGVDLYRDEAMGTRRVTRTQQDIEQSGGDDYLLVVPLTTPIEFAQFSPAQRCDPGDAILFSTAMPFAAVSDGDRYSQYLARISGKRLREIVPAIDHCSTQIFNMRTGAGAIATRLFDAAIDEADALSPMQSRTFGRMLIDAIANVVGDYADADSADAGAGSPLRIRVRAKAYIDENLADPQLNVASIAAHCGVSERYVHAAFAAASERVGALIRERRLLACQRALRSPDLDHLSITEIAFQWGFEDSSHFSRAYKTRFGIAPRSERHQSQPPTLPVGHG